MEDCDLVILVFACDTVEKYRNQMKAIDNTWGRKCQEYPNIRLLYFLGEEEVEYFPQFEDSQITKYIHLKGVANDYGSASYKQWLGLKYVYEHYRPKFTICIGTDTYINIPKLLSFLETYDPSCHLYIGGHSDIRQIGNRRYKFQSGGPGFIITYPILEKLYPSLQNIMEDWIRVCSTNNVNYLINACDVGIAYYLDQPELKATFVDGGEAFISCNYRGNPCCLNKIDMTKIISCHLMSLQDFQDFTQILEGNNYFM